MSKILSPPLNIAPFTPITPKAQAAYEAFFGALGEKPVQNSLAFHWARAIEALYAAERLLELAQELELDVRILRGAG